MGSELIIRIEGLATCRTRVEKRPINSDGDGQGHVHCDREEQNEDFRILQFWIHSWLDSSG